MYLRESLQIFISEYSSKYRTFEVVESIIVFSFSFKCFVKFIYYFKIVDLLDYLVIASKYKISINYAHMYIQGVCER